MKGRGMLALLGLLLLGLGGCVSLPAESFQPPVVGAFVSPPVTQPVAAPAAPQTYRLFLPMWQPPHAGKLGLSGGTPEQAQVLGASWLYDWSPAPPVDEWIESVPMIGHAGVVDAALGGNSQWILGFNEPDLTVQSNISPERAGVLWREIERLYPGRKLVSPAVIDPLWLDHMRNDYISYYGTAPRFDAIAWHCYEWNAAGCIALGERFLRLAELWGVPEVWVTEFVFVRAHTADPEREARTFVAWLERQPLIKRYSPFANWSERGSWYWPDTRAEADPSLFTGPTSTLLTEVGGWYRPLR